MYLFESRLSMFRTKKKIVRKLKKNSNSHFKKKNRKYGNWIKRTNERMKYFLMNILSNKILRIKSTLPKLKEMIKILIEYKYGEKKEQSLEEFLEKNIKFKV